MANTEKVEFEFPEPEETKEDLEIEIEGVAGRENVLETKAKADAEPEPRTEPEPEVETESKAEIEIVDDTPPEDRNRVPSDPPEDLTEEELNSYLKHLNKLGCLSVSVREARAAVSSGVAVSVPSKKCGRPRKSIRNVDEVDIIADLTAKANDESCVSKAEAKAAKLAKKAQLKAEKAQLKAEKERLKSEKAQLKAQEKAAKLAAKEKAKADKLAAKEKAKAEKKAAKAALKEKKAAKAKKELARKTKEAKELKKKFNMEEAKAEHTELVEEDILNEKGEVVGSKVEGFNVPPQKKIIEVENDEREYEVEVETPEGVVLFKHKSRPNETLYKDEQDDIFSDKGEHIAHYDSVNDILISLSDSDEELEELSDTE